ncbi:MAG: LPP20 family lipoprotein [Treponema sp.]|uniref:LPP20 family lipoprotein n=1 Tax=Treponema sp. TaxID=166 RepID=UPI0025CD3D1B|nr:LPP20 family lipoprotein [Treponema sp.]MBQ8678524.1 LPP20 family lipoprotein [Treponema sp.]
MFRGFLKNILFILLLAFVSPIFATENIPTWMHDKNSVYPSSEYISALGSGKSKKIAMEDALAGISRYLRTEIKSNVKAETKADSTNGKSTYSQKLEETMTISSSATLSGIEYTKPYYAKNEKTWYCVAYISREYAWNQYLPKIENAKSAFYSFYDKATEENEPVFKCRFYKMTQESAENLLITLDYARLLHPQNEEKYSVDRKIASTIPSLIENERQKCTVFLDIKGDYGNIFSSVISKILVETGFLIVEDGNNANYVAAAVIENNIIGENPLSITPSLDFKLAGKYKTVYSFSDRLENKTTAYELENAQKKAYPQLVEKIAKKISLELSELLGN